MSQKDRYVYKKSGLDWIDAIPQHWAIMPNRALFFESSIKNQINEQLLSITIANGIITQSELLNKSSKKDSSNTDKSNYKLVEPNDIAYNKMRAWQGAIGVSNHRGIVSPAYIVYKPRNSQYMRYYHYLFRTPSMIKEFQKWSYGITSDQWSLRSKHFRLIEIIIPPYKEQKQIVSYLDHKSRLINKFIQIKKKQIDLLKELKQAIINDVVTGKIEVSTGKPYPKYKDSGIEWLGMIPEEWSVAKLRNVALVKPSGVDKKIDKTERQVRLCNYTDVYNNEYIIDDMNFMMGTVSEIEYNGFLLSKGDIVITKDSEMWNDIAVPSLVNEEVKDLVCAYHLCIIRLKDNLIVPDFMLRALQTKTYQYQFHVAANGITRFGISKNSIKDALIAIPPKIDQLVISNFLQSFCSKIDSQIELMNKQIPVVQDLQDRLVSDVVTGKLDVRGFNAIKESKSSDIPFKRTVLAAEIIKQLYMEPTLGHVKFQKVLFLSERLCQLDIGTNYHRAAAGPHDSKALKSIDEQLSKMCWYEAQEIEGRFKYLPLAKAGEHEKYFVRYFSNIEKELNRIISTLRTLDTQRCEMIATLFSAWEDLLSNNNQVKDSNIIHEVTENWTSSKKRIPLERWNKCLAWMRENYMTPLDVGRFNAD